MPEPVTSIYPEGSPTISRVCVLGASGLVGTALISSLLKAGVAVTAFSRTRRGDAAGLGHWDPAAGQIEAARLEGADAVANFAGANLGEGRWTAARKRELWASRVDSTALLCRALAGLQRKPAVLVNASAVGFYGHRGDDAVYEDSPPGKGFLAELCEAWEAATEPAVAAGIRVVKMRFGVILTPEGGVLARMLPTFRHGLGGRFGGGEQRMPWIALADAVSATRFAMRHPDLAGPVNAVAPEPVTNAQLCDALAHALGKRAPLPVPALALKAMFGAEMARELLLTGANVRPRRLEITGYRFEYPRLEDALEAMFGAQSGAG
ncbi:MAG: TIGR01777 family oxidoreductase [Polyangiales bacterium]